MKHLPLGLFVGHLLFISAKSIINPLSYQEAIISLLLLSLVVGKELFFLLYKKNYRSHVIEKAKLELQNPVAIDPEIASLQKENEISALRLRKFMTEQEFSKREIARTVEKNIGDSGLRF